MSEPIKHNPYPTGTNEYYKWGAEQAGFTDVGEWLRHVYATTGKCPHCGTTYGFAMGTGDCDCDPDPS